MVARLLAEGLLFWIAVAFVVFPLGRFALRYVPWLRRFTQRHNRRAIEREVYYFCKVHGAIQPEQAVMTALGTAMCPQCFHQKLLERK